MSEINELALKVLDNNLFDAVPHLLMLLDHSDTGPNKGTVIFVLNELDVEIPVRTIGKIIIFDSWESKQEALNNLFKFERALTESELNDTITMLYPYHHGQKDKDLQECVMQALLHLREFNKDVDGLYREPKFEVKK